MSDAKRKSAEYQAAEALFGMRAPKSEAADAGAGPGERPARLPTETLVLRDEVTAASLVALADAEGWRLHEETARAHLVLASRRWVTTSGEEVTYVIDHPGAAQSLRIEGTWAPALAKRLREWLPCYAEGELLEVVLDTSSGEPDPVACVRVASKLAAIRPEAPEPRHVAALAAMLGHSVDAVRRAGIRSAYGCRWKELRALVERRRAVEQRLGVQLEELRQWLDGEGEGR